MEQLSLKEMEELLLEEGVAHVGVVDHSDPHGGPLSFVYTDGVIVAGTAELVDEKEGVAMIAELLGNTGCPGTGIVGQLRGLHRRRRNGSRSRCMVSNRDHAWP